MQIRSLLQSSIVLSHNLRKELVCFVATKWPNEYKRLCEPMKCSPSALPGLVNMSEKDLPSSILLQNNLLLDEKGQAQTEKRYDRTAYVELNRGMSSAIALSYLLRDDCYDELVEGQKNEIALSKEDYLQLHTQFREIFKKDEIWDEHLLDVMFYAVLFNDLGKNIQIKQILHEQYQMKEYDHDLILRNAFQIDGFLKDFSQFNPAQKRCLNAMWHSGFNPSSFDTLEYPLSMVVNWVMSFANIAKENTNLYLAMKKIEILIDIAGVCGNSSKGAINLTTPVVEKFKKSFALLSQLFIVYQQQLENRVTDNSLIYTAILTKLKELLWEQAKNLKITSSNDFTPRTILLFRLCKMIGANNSEQTNIIDTVLNKIERQNLEGYQVLEREFLWEHDNNKPVLWLECIPKFIWLMSNGNHYDLIDNNSSGNKTARQENGLYASLLIVSNILKKIRDNNQYEALYSFENHELVKVSADKVKETAGQSIMALFVAYDLVRVAQQASESNLNIGTRLEAVQRLKVLWAQGVLIEGRYITINKLPLTQSQNSLVTKTSHLFNNHQKFVIEQQSKWFELLSKETNEHCAYLASVGWGERANYFKVKNFIYRDIELDSVNVHRIQVMPLPDLFHTFDTEEKNTLFANPDSTQEQEIKRALDIRLYPSIRRIIEKQGATLFLGSKIELQAYAASCKEKLIIEIEIPSSVKFYIALNTVGDIKVYMSGLVSHENLLQQLITLKLAGIDSQKITILGDTQQYKSICKADLIEFEKNASTYLTKRNVLIVAGCTLENTVCTTLEQIFSGKMTQHRFSGQIISLTYVQSPYAPNLGFIVLNLNYGEICEEQISIMLEKFNCIGIFTGSAAGYIPNAAEEKPPTIGDRLSIQSARHHLGEVIALDKNNKNLHLHVPTIFVETFKWLEQAKELGATTVDVETFYILRAVHQFQKANPHVKLHADIGVFISDYVGEKPLRSYNNVFAQYPTILQNFIKQVLVANITSSYNNNRITIPTFSSHYIELKPEIISISPEIKGEAVVDSIGKPWDKSEFSKRVHTPVTIGAIKDKDRFTSQIVPRCIHLPIKLPGSNIKIPAEYQVFLDELQQIFNFEASINPGLNDLYAYLTVDQGVVPRANSQRVPGPHVDGIPRDRENPGSQIIDHAYLATNAIPTLFYAQQFDMSSYDPRIHHFFAIFRALSDEHRTITAELCKILLMNAYSVHTPTQALEDVNRTFIRVEFSTLKFDRVGNSINPHFSSDDKFPDYPFNYIPRPIPDNLFVPPSVYLNKPITNEDYTHVSIDQFGRVNLQAFFTQSSKYPLKSSYYKNLDRIAEELMNLDTQGIVFCYQGIPHSFCLYKIENKTVKLDTLFTLENGKGQEMLVLQMKVLKNISDKLSIQAGLEEGVIPLTIVVNENNEKMLPIFLRAARLSKLQINIERLEANHQLNPSMRNCN